MKLQHQEDDVVLDCFFFHLDRSVVGVAHEEERLSEGRCSLFGEQSAFKRWSSEQKFEIEICVTQMVDEQEKMKLGNCLPIAFQPQKVCVFVSVLSVATLFWLFIPPFHPH